MHLPAVPWVVVEGIVPDRTVVPEGQRPWLPDETTSELVLPSMFVEALEYRAGFVVSHAVDTDGEAGVDE